MRILLLLVTLLVTLALVTSSPRNSLSDLNSRYEQYMIEQDMAVKGVLGHKPSTPRSVSLRKGEYMCGNRVCKLQPGQMPVWCNGICQYPVK